MPEPKVDGAESRTLIIEELAAVRGELVRADEKSATLVTLAGAELALATVARPHGSVAAWLVGTGLACAVVAMVQLLQTIRPRLRGGGLCRHAVIEDSLGAVDPDAWRRRELMVLSQIALRKLRLLRIAAHLLACSLIFVFAAELAGLA